MYTVYVRLFDRAPHARQRLLAVASPDDDLGQQRIVIGRRGVAREHVGVHAHPWTAGEVRGVDVAGVRRETARWVL